MVIDIIISIVLLGALFFNIAFLYVLKEKLNDLKEKLDDIEEYINDTHIRMDSIEEQMSEENMEKAASNVFKLVDDILEGNKDLEDLENEEQQSI